MDSTFSSVLLAQPSTHPPLLSSLRPFAVRKVLRNNYLRTPHRQTCPSLGFRQLCVWKAQELKCSILMVPPSILLPPLGTTRSPGFAPSPNLPSQPSYHAGSARHNEILHFIGPSCASSTRN